MSLFEKKNQFVTSVDECLGNAVKQGIFHLNTTTDAMDGRFITINNDQKVLNFGSCSYLGLEMDERLKQGAIDAILAYGTQFSSSRAFLSCGLYTELEALISEMFNAHCLVSATTTLGHLSSIPVLVADNDAVILDHQVHGSVQNAVQLLKPRGVHVEMIRHNQLDALEEKIKELRNKHYRIWYMADGVYSMYGDYAPIKELYALMDKYPQLHLYVDDAHGMSWAGPNGTGYITSQVKLRPQVYLVTSLNKAFAAGGGALIFTDPEDMRKVRTGGSSFVFSGPMQPASLGAAIASAKIHLTQEITSLQNQLKERLVYCDQLIKEYKLPYVFSSGSPIFYIGLGIPAMGYNMVRQLIKEGFYVDIGIFPGVPLKRTGIRLAINIHMSFTDIKNVVEAIARCYPKALLEEQQSIKEIGKHFRMDFLYASHLDPPKQKAKQELILKHYTSIGQLDKNLWNTLLGDRGNFDWEGCKFLEDVFKENPEPESNWNFNYYLIYENETPVLATFVTELLNKDDMLSPESVSMQIEEERKKNPYYLTSKVMMMGSLLTEGEHLYLDKNSGQWQQAMDLFIKDVQDRQEACGASGIYLRDIDAEDEVLKVYLINKGFAKSDMPDSWIIEDLTWENEEEMINKLTYRSRKHVRQNISRYIDNFIIEVNSNKPENSYKWYNLYKRVKEKSLKLNTFNLPEKIFEQSITNPNWDIIELYVKTDNNDKELAGVVFSYKNNLNYCPVFLGINYDFIQSHSIYRQIIYQLIMRGKHLGCRKIYLGVEASEEKRKFGARQKSHSVFIQANENFSLSKLSQYSNNKI
jgi:7-keto-8-aminopelargonate synthetase-like enzyme